MDEIVPTNGQAMTDFILTMFRVNNLTLSWGDRLVSPLGLTSARWQVLGAIAYAERPQPVAWLARDLGANRQNVQRIVNDLEAEGIIKFEPNPHHKRAHLVVLTEKGQRVFEGAMQLYNPRIEDIAADFSLNDIRAALRVMAVFKAKLEAFAEAGTV
jgi:DNA-binding MarR family transcriptional regulator